MIKISVRDFCSFEANNQILPDTGMAVPPVHEDKSDTTIAVFVAVNENDMIRDCP
jgi:hypothetical protein